MITYKKNYNYIYSVCLHAKKQVNKFIIIINGSPGYGQCNGRRRFEDDSMTGLCTVCTV